MLQGRRIFSRRALDLARQPAAWRAMLLQQVWAARTPCGLSLPVSNAPQQVAVRWPVEYASRDAQHFVAPLTHGLARLAHVEESQIPQRFPGLVIFDVALDDGHPHRVAIDYLDVPSVNPACYEEVSLYFKFQHLRAGYGLPNVVPGGYVAGKPALYHNYCRLRCLHTHRSKHDVYGRFGLRYARELRVAALGLLRDQNRFSFLGGDALVLYMQSLLEAARARVCIDLPGNGPFCYRLVEYLAIGCCIIGPRHRAVLPEGLQDRVNIVYCRDDLSDLQDLCFHYVSHDDERETIAANAARYFDAHLHPLQLASYYLATCIARLGQLQRSR